jgi:hypothetical protein
MESLATQKVEFKHPRRLRGQSSLSNLVAPLATIEEDKELQVKPGDLLKHLSLTNVAAILLDRNEADRRTILQELTIERETKSSPAVTPETSNNRSSAMIVKVSSIIRDLTLAAFVLHFVAKLAVSVISPIIEIAVESFDPLYIGHLLMAVVVVVSVMEIARKRTG